MADLGGAAEGGPSPNSRHLRWQLQQHRGHRWHCRRWRRRQDSWGDVAPEDAATRSDEQRASRGRGRSSSSTSGGSAGSAFIEYVAASRRLGGRGWPMVLMAEAVCKREGLHVLYSAADLLMDGRFADHVPAGGSPSAGEGDEGGASSSGDGSGEAVGGTSAVAAHRRWGFVPISAEDWKGAGLELYDPDKCSVSYMMKAIKQ